MGVTTTNKELSTSVIECGGSFKIKLSLAAEPDIVSNPTDIVLILDRSRSMSGSPLANLKSGAKRFIEIIDESTDSAHDGHIGNGSHIGIVSFSDTASQDTQLITSVADLNAAVNALTANGFTNHADAFEKAMKTMTIPAHSGDSCRDVTVRCIKFVLPEDLDVSGTSNGICNKKAVTVACPQFINRER